MKPSLVICEDHPIYKKGLYDLLCNDYNIIGVFDSGKSLLNFFKTQNTIDFLILDLSLPLIDGFEVLKTIKNKNIYVKKIIILSVHNDHLIIKKTKQFGAHAFCSKSISNIDLKKVLQSSSQDFYIDSSINLPGATIHRHPSKATYFTKKECEIINLLVEGLAVKEIASILTVSVNTINTHKKNIFKKLQINSTPELIKYVYEYNLN